MTQVCDFTSLQVYLLGIVFYITCVVLMVLEFSNPHGPFGLPTVCGFIPSLAAGTPFQISIHSWSAPSVSQFTRCYSKYGECANFEARVFVDGQLVAYANDSQCLQSWLANRYFLVLRLLIEKVIGHTLLFTLLVWTKAPIDVCVRESFLIRYRSRNVKERRSGASSISQLSTGASAAKPLEPSR